MEKTSGWPERCIALRRAGATVADLLDPALEIDDHCREHLAAFKCPRQIVFREEIPKSASGKILARVLRNEVR